MKEPRGRSPRVALAIGRGAVTVVVRDKSGTRVAAVPVDLPQTGDASVALNTAFTEAGNRIAEWLGRAPAGLSVDVALLPPLAEARLLDVPPLKPGEVEAIVRRDAARYFLGGVQPRVIGVSVPRQAPDSPRRPVLAVAVPAALAEAVHAAARAAGWRVNRLVAAQSAWVRAARHTGNATNASELRGVITVHDGHAHVFRIEGDALVSIRRVAAGEATSIVDALGEPGGPVLVLAPANTALAEALSAAGWSPRTMELSEPTGAVDSAQPAALTAALLAGEAAPVLVPLSVLASSRDRQRRLGARLLAAAAVLVVAAAGIELWGAHRELAALQARRAEIRAQVGPLLETRDSIAAMSERTASIQALAEAAPRWTRALTDIAIMLPFETHLTRLVADGDMIEIEAAGARAGEALQALRAAPSLRDVRMIGLVDRELEDGAPAVERFRIAARMAPPAEAASTKKTAESGGAEP